MSVTSDIQTLHSQSITPWNNHKMWIFDKIIGGTNSNDFFVKMLAIHDLYTVHIELNMIRVTIIHEIENDEEI